jgi:hypothetical protein
LLAVGAGVGYGAPGPSWAGEWCARPDEESALFARALQTELMVGALACDRRSEYNAFVVRFRDELAARGRLLRTFFHRAHGRDFEVRLNAFVTQLANEASARSAEEGEGYCAGMTRLFSLALGAREGGLDGLVTERRRFLDHGIAACPDRGTALSPLPRDRAR